MEALLKRVSTAFCHISFSFVICIPGFTFPSSCVQNATSPQSLVPRSFATPGRLSLCLPLPPRIRRAQTRRGNLQNTRRQSAPGNRLLLSRRQLRTARVPLTPPVQVVAQPSCAQPPGREGCRAETKHGRLPGETTTDPARSMMPHARTSRTRLTRTIWAS